MKRHILHCLLFLMVLWLCPIESVLAAANQRMEFGSSPNPVGSGARAIGMGGAFIAIADDATAASWNPGGLIQLERPEVSVVGEGILRSENNSFKTNPEASGRQSVSNASLNYLSAVYPFTLAGLSMIVSVNYQHLYDFDREWNFNVQVLKDKWNIQYQQNGGLYAYGIAYAIQIVPSLSLGVTANIWQDGLYQNEWSQTVFLNGKLFNSDRYQFQGFNANIGALWTPTDKLSIGAVFKTPFTASLQHTHSEPTLKPSRISSSEDLDMPMSYGLGAAYHVTDRLILSADFYRTRWQDFVLTDPRGNSISPISGRPSSKSDVQPTTQIRLGGEYFIIKPPYTVPLRAGVFYDPAPAEGSPDTFLGFSLGSGINIGRFIFDFAYQYRFGRNVGSSILQNLGFSQNVDEHAFFSSVIVHF